MYFLAIALFFVGGIVQGCLGFGLAMVVVPPMLLFLPATIVVPTLVATSFLNTSSVAWHLRHHVERGIVARLVTGAVLGMPLGIYLLKTLDGPVFKIGVGVFMVVLALVLLSGWSRPLRNPHAALYPVGFMSGLLTGSISISGPPVILFLASQATPRDVFRANIVTYFSLSGMIALVGFAVSGMLTWEVARYAAGLIPSVLLGTWIGVRLAGRISQTFFERLTLVTVILMGFVLLGKNLVELI